MPRPLMTALTSAGEALPGRGDAQPPADPVEEDHRKFRIVYHRDKFLTAQARDFIALCRNFEETASQHQYPGLC